MSVFEIIAFFCIAGAALLFVVSELIASAPYADDDEAYGDTTNFGRDE